MASFTTSFNFQLTNAVADGFAFVIQTDTPSVVAAYGGGLGYIGLSLVVTLRFDLSNDIGAGADATGLSVNGAVQAVNLSQTGVNLHGGDVINATIAYIGATLLVTLTDATTGATASQSYAVNIPAAVGSSTAYVGFSGATGNQAATQNILNWTYITS